MKQFNLEEYLTNPKRKVITRHGKSVRIICVDRLDDRYPVVAFIRLADDYEDIWAFTKYGEFSERGENNYDLFFEPTKKEGWVNIHDDGCHCPYSGQIIYDSKEDAENNGKTKEGYISTAKIEWEE